jgi:hypothetical protein
MELNSKFDKLNIPQHSNNAEQTTGEPYKPPSRGRSEHSRKDTESNFKPSPRKEPQFKPPPRKTREHPPYVPPKSSSSKDTYYKTQPESRSSPKYEPYEKQQQQQLIPNFNLGKSKAYKPVERIKKIPRESPTETEPDRKQPKASPRVKRSKSPVEDTRPKAKARTQMSLRKQFSKPADFVAFMKELKNVEVTEATKHEYSKIFIDAIGKYNFTSAYIKLSGFLDVPVIKANSNNIEAVGMLYAHEKRDYDHKIRKLVRTIQNVKTEEDAIKVLSKIRELYKSENLAVFIDEEDRIFNPDYLKFVSQTMNDLIERKLISSKEISIHRIVTKVPEIRQIEDFEEVMYSLKGVMNAGSNDVIGYARMVKKDTGEGVNLENDDL